MVGYPVRNKVSLQACTGPRYVTQPRRRCTGAFARCTAVIHSMIARVLPVPVGNPKAHRPGRRPSAIEVIASLSAKRHFLWSMLSLLPNRSRDLMSLYMRGSCEGVLSVHLRGFVFP